MEPATPASVLYPGTGHKAVELILQTRLCKMSRHHVHLSSDVATAKTVGARHGKPVVFAVDAAGMHESGYTFYCSDNGVWLVDAVPPEYKRDRTTGVTSWHTYRAFAIQNLKLV